MTVGPLSAVVTTDGSCRSSGIGGWCAIVERGSYGQVLRGTADGTTNVRMELLAMIEGLRAVPRGMKTTLRTDSTVALNVKWTRKRDMLLCHVVDRDLWVQLKREMGRRDVAIEIVRRRDRVLAHQRAHAIAGMEARHRELGRPAPTLPPIRFPMPAPVLGRANLLMERLPPVRVGQYRAG